MLHSHKLSFRLGIALVVAGLLVCARAKGEASLTVRLATSSSQFKVGQIIPLELTFRASDANTYSFNVASNDHSGRLDMEEFEVTPEGRDPLYAYYHNPLTSLNHEGLSGIAPLGKEPQILRRDLNEWVALDKPGRYSLRVLSGRVGGVTTTAEKPKPLVSNVVTFDIVEADAAWQKQTLSQAVRSLNGATTPQSERDEAERTLRYLDSPESIHELVRQLTKPNQSNHWNFTAGLLGARDQALVLRELEARFDAPSAALTRDYLWLLSEAEFARTHQPLPPYPSGNVKEQERWEKKRDALLAGSRQADDLLYQRAAAALALKSGAAQLTTAATLSKHQSERSK